MLILIILMLILYQIVKNTYYVVYDITCKVKARGTLLSIRSKQDLLFMHFRAFEHLVAEIFRREGHRVRFSDKFGEGDNGLILDDLCYVVVKKHSPGNILNVEQAKKLADQMYKDSIYRGMYITLGDFSQSTKNFCHKSAIKCINGDELLDLCFKVQSEAIVEDGYANGRVK